jgi:hypothetical protein
MTIDESIAHSRRAVFDVISASWQRSVARAVSAGADAVEIDTIDAAYGAEVQHADVELRQLRERLIATFGYGVDVAPIAWADLIAALAAAPPLPDSEYRLNCHEDRDRDLHE